jgi:hypothetical protein
MDKRTQQSQHMTAQRRRRRGAIGSLLWLAFGSGVAAFSSPSSMMTMKVDLVGRRTTSTTESSSNQMGGRKLGIPTGSQLDMICQDQNEFEMSVGHAMDVLRQDYPHILNDKPGKPSLRNRVHLLDVLDAFGESVKLTKSFLFLLWIPPQDFSIYDANLELIDPSGVQLHGLKNYKTSFQLLHAVVAIFYCPERSGLTFRMCYDKARQNIRIHWNAQVIPKAIFGGYKTTLHVDGISVYEISRNSGNITQHRIERLLINDASVTPEQGIFAALRGHAVKSDVDSIPVFNTDMPVVLATADPQWTRNSFWENRVLEFHNFYPLSRSLLFSSEEEGDRKRIMQKKKADSSELSAMDASSMESSTDGEALEKKNLARKNFGLDPLTPEEFTDLQEKVRELDNQQQQRAAVSAAEMASKKKKEEGGFFKKLMAGVLEDTCDSNYDCESPEVCCDFGFKKMCCSSGMRVIDGPPRPRSRFGDLAEIPVYGPPPNYPPSSDPQGGYRY